MRLTRLGRATVIGLVVSGAFALGQAWAAPLVNGEREHAPAGAFTIPGSRIQVVDLTGTAELGPIWQTNGATVRWTGGEGPLTVGPDWGTYVISWTQGRRTQTLEVGEFEAITIVLDEGAAPRVARPAPAPF